MATLDYQTAGESHGPALTVLIQGFPADVPIDLALINGELRRRQGGFGRGGRMKIEQDEAIALSGVRSGLSTGAPLVLQISNKDSRLDAAPPIHRPRPGHADFAGAMKWLTADCRNTLERASARETAGRVAAGALAKCLLRDFGVEAVGFVSSIGAVQAQVADQLDADSLRRDRDSNEVYTPDAAVAERMIEAIRAAKTAKDTIGGIVEVRVFNLPPGLGSCASWQQKLDGRLMQAVGSIQAFKGVEIGLGFAAAALPGSLVHDAIYFDASARDMHNFGFTRKTNRAGGLEGGMTNGQTLIVRGAMKPISTLLQGMDSVDLQTRNAARSDYERSDICAVPAASVVAENVVAFEIARAWVGKFAGDTLGECRAAHRFYCEQNRNR